MESYLSKWASVLGSVISFTATTSTSGSATAARNTFLPMRPNPLIPTLTAISVPPELLVCEVLCYGYLPMASTKWITASGFGDHIHAAFYRGQADKGEAEAPGKGSSRTFAGSIQG